MISLADTPPPSVSFSLFIFYVVHNVPVNETMRSRREMNCSEPLQRKRGRKKVCYYM